MDISGATAAPRAEGTWGSLPALRPGLRILTETLDRIDGLERLDQLDPLADRLRPFVRSLPLGAVREGLRGGWLGYSAHPALVQIPIGCWTSAAVLDLVPGERRAATLLVALGFLGALPTELAGWVDWAELPTAEERRVGLVHAAAGATATALYGLSWTARLRGRSGRGRVLGFAGLAVVTVAGMIGGHLAHGGSVDAA
ncbi:DUF2231 domain-containing protein [Streptacidiphilus anmyonensis]|uniref:DUF2231 domain-containing protein n=1 Tax=Streptacidiphilus anmyonensis TaxID=405782 RepID=UPI000694B864|nr:DUF2231 domain-containing protein [Streptacidiphilus anmyonensis]